MATKVEIKSNPFTVSVIDYHEFNVVLDYFKQAGIKLDYQECPNLDDRGRYVGIFWLKGTKMKVQKKIDEILKKNEESE